MTTSSYFVNNNLPSEIPDYVSTNFIQGVYVSNYRDFANVNAPVKSILFSENGTDISGNIDLTHKSNTGVLSVNQDLSYTSSYPIGIENAFNDPTYCTGLLAQNKDATDGSSISILLTNDVGTDNKFYGGLTMYSSNSTPEYNQFVSIKNVLSLNSQSSSIVIGPWNGQQDGSSNENGNIMLCYNGAQKAHIINNNGQLILGADNPSFSGDTYGGDNGGINRVLTSNGENGLTWTGLGGLTRVLHSSTSYCIASGPAETITVLTTPTIDFDITKAYQIQTQFTYAVDVIENNQIINYRNSSTQYTLVNLEVNLGYSSNNQVFYSNTTPVFTVPETSSFPVEIIVSNPNNTCSVSSTRTDYYNITIYEVNYS